MRSNRLGVVYAFPRWATRLAVLLALCGQVMLGGMTVQAQSAPDAPHDAVITNCANDAQLRAALLAAGPSTVTFDCGTGAHTIPISAYMEIAGQITIDGAGVITLDGGDTASLIQVFASGRVTLQNITLANGMLNGSHPVDNLGNLTLNNVTMSSNQSDGTGGAIYNLGTLLVRNSRFIDNRGLATSIITNGGAIYSLGTATVQDSIFTNNVLSGTIGLGGAIFVSNGRFTIERSTFRGNYALDGGALHVGAGTIVTVTKSIFADNRAGYGAAIESLGELQLDYSELTGNDAANDGGAVWVSGSDLDVTYSTFRDNTAGTTGGAISCYADNVSIINSTLSGNQAGSYGGGLYSTCNVNLSNTTIHGNSAVTGGGGIYIAGGSFASVAFATISQNSAPFGEGVYNDNVGGSTLTLQAALLANNGAANCDGVITSNGYNFSSDTLCGTFVQTGDRQNVPLPLGPLQSNGGPTFTRIPARTNPVINAIPAALCGFANDQRDVVRPQAAACDSGAVEVFYSLYFPKLRR